MKKYIIIATVSLILIFAMYAGCKSISADIKADQQKLHPVTRNELVDAYITNRIDDLKDSQFMGDAEVGLKGDITLYLQIRADAHERFPKGRQFFRNYYHDVLYRYTKVDKYIFMYDPMIHEDTP